MTNHVLNAVFPELCIHCGIRVPESELLCADCLPAGGLRRAPDLAPADGICRRFSFVYEGAAKSLFAAAKFSDRSRPLNFFIQAVRNELLEMCGENVLFLAVPSRRRFLARLLTAIVPADQLILDAFTFRREARSTTANKLLGEAGRYRRIHDSLAWNGQRVAPAEKYIICDDVSTTGATLAHAAHLVHRNLDTDKSSITAWALMYRERHFLIPRQ